MLSHCGEVSEMLEQIMKDAQFARIDGRAAPDAYRCVYFIADLSPQDM